MFQLSPEGKQKILAELKRYESKQSAVLPALYIGQRENKGYITPAVIEELSRVMEIPESQINEVFTFYSMYNKKSVGKHHVQVCRTLSCMLNGAAELSQHLCNELNVQLDQVTADGRFTISEVECLGSCGTAPMMQVGDKYYENLTPESAMNLLRAMK
ncbi:MAG: NADH dehydrogenase [Bdellovibrionales bacterium RIFCSPHIGHO2_01_FULL_40_29]|nr:MAG: NADH dehydrogenase [Bdellovibrionales bacterium RIFCSPHIGHO2_01_FULL_40_29]OFZ33955.1 MAG: NADH dehydrogenase [Bdellovibrionales bacterium RIFCSPHIGHO2_02_FULL_40_15]